ncbi:hypothetical protein VTL71DRAFT_9496 [Oculimacula yallundae]|uniref:Uncharacterized protein n=1 Tax=Oculimacula yallundae TaxID=86028 RepID=A0ABR4BS85_9HELO
MVVLVDHVSYNSLPSLEESNISRQSPSIEKIMNGPIRDVFLKHAANVAFCLYLQHRHHAIGVDDAIVKVEGTAHLMDSQAVKVIASLGNKVVPTTWMTSISRGQVLPMELAVVPAATATSTPSPSFLLDFYAVLSSTGCNGLFGIDTIAEKDWSEMKIGEASVVVPNNNDGNHFDKDMFIPVAFRFDKEEPKFKVHGKCKKDHDHSSKPPSK